jgi:metal-sulfur cluster biosynthetic enzyme
MNDKDNANPIIHAQAQKSQRIDDSARTEWWRDVALTGNAINTNSTKSSFATLPDYDSGYAEADDYDLALIDDEKKGIITTEKVGEKDVIDAEEVFDLVRSISDPEHPLTLEQLAVVNVDHVTVDEGDSNSHKPPTVSIALTPTIPHCSMATLIGLTVRVRLLRALPSRYKIDVRVRPGTHQSENAVNKQLNDKERVAAALENQHLLGVVSDCLATAGRRGASEEEALKRADELAIELGLTV